MSKAKSPFPDGIFQKNENESLKIIELTKELKMKIDHFYQHLLNSDFPCDALYWALAKLQLIFEKGSKKYDESDVIKRAEKFFDSDLDYDTLYWLISSFKTYLEEIKLYP